MNVRTAKKPERRVDIGYVSRFNMQRYGNDNLYPQNLRLIAKQSGTTELCMARYSKFIEGYGFTDERLSETIMNAAGETADDLLHKVAADVARYGGFALHVNYNVMCQVSSVNFIPFENCRLEEEDDAGNVAHILLHPDWSARKTRNGRRINIDEKSIDRLPVFNPDQDVVSRQIADSGGITQYQGQVIWVSLEGGTVYPTPIYDSVITDISTDEGLGNIKYRNVRNNFLVSCMLIAKKGLPKIDDNGNEVEQSMITDDDLRAFQGDEKAAKIMYVELENDEDKPEVVAFPTKNYDKDFATTDASVIERIYAQFHQELFYAIRIGKLGFSGQVMQDAYEYYAGEVTTEQRAIQRVFARILAAWQDQTLADADVTLQPLKYITAEQTTVNTTDDE